MWRTIVQTLLTSFIILTSHFLWKESFIFNVNAEIDPNAKGDPLFPENHPNITFLTDKNWNIHFQKLDKPWLIDFYHPFCPHCNHFVPYFHEIAAHYKQTGTVYIGAISCMDHVKCRRVGIAGFPTLMALNFDKKRPGLENKRVVGTHTVQEVYDFVDGIFLEAAVNETGTYPPGMSPPASTQAGVAVAAKVTTKAPRPGEEKRKEIWEETTLPQNQTTRIQDAASAFVFGLKQGVFMGREVLEDEEFDALKGWLRMVSEAFPGSFNRAVILKLYQDIKDKALLDFDTWESIVNNWQAQSTVVFNQEKEKYDWTSVNLPEWQKIDNLFIGQGASYRSCAMYTCGQWNMFHMLTMNPFTEPDERSKDLMVSVIASMRRFMKHFFGCVQCREHFLEYNNLEMVESIANAPNIPLALRRWLWKMHNAVNTRVRHYEWPKPNICPTCGQEGNWNLVEVDKWLRSQYAFKEIKAPLKSNTEITTQMTNENNLGVDQKQPLLRREGLINDNEEQDMGKDNAVAPMLPPAEAVAEDGGVPKPPLLPEEAAEKENEAEPRAPEAPQQEIIEQNPVEKPKPLSKDINSPPDVTKENAVGNRDTYVKDADLGIKNAANSLTLPPVVKHESEMEKSQQLEKLSEQDGLIHHAHNANNSPELPSITIFGWYFLPLAAVGLYILYVRSRQHSKSKFRR